MTHTHIVSPDEVTCTKHSCDLCGKKLFPENKWFAIGTALVITSPFVLILTLQYFFPGLFDQPKCYYREQLTEEVYYQQVVRCSNYE